MTAAGDSPAATAPSSSGPTRPRRLTDEEAAAFVADQDAALARVETEAGVALVTGAGASITVRLGHLVIEDGIADSRRVRRFPRVALGYAVDGAPGGDPAQSAAKLGRVVVEAGSGMLTLGAIAWCRAVGVSLAGIDRDGELLWTTWPDGPRDARITRALAAAGSGDDDPVGLSIVVNLLRAKLAGQWDIARVHLANPEAANTIAEIAAVLEDAESITEARQLEASAAAVYFDAWSANLSCVPRFTPRDTRRVPTGWATYSGRRSGIGAGATNRRASHPTNAILNYCFTIARNEATVALCRLGLDPSLGILHRDTARRDSLACDLEEVARPEVERYVLELLRERTFRRVDFLEGPSGEVRLGMTLRQDLAATAPLWATVLAPHAEGVRNVLVRAIRGGTASRSGIKEASPLSGARRKAAAESVSARKAAARTAGLAAVRTRTRRGQRPTAAPDAEASRRSDRVSRWTCPSCGGPVGSARHVLCEPCQEAAGHTASVRQTRGKAIAARKRALREWEQAHPGAAYDPELFARDIMPRLRTVKLSKIMEATGACKATASSWRNGHTAPHVSTWPALARLAGVEPSAGVKDPQRQSVTQPAPTIDKEIVS